MSVYSYWIERAERIGEFQKSSDPARYLEHEGRSIVCETEDDDKEVGQRLQAKFGGYFQQYHDYLYLFDVPIARTADEGVKAGYQNFVVYNHYMGIPEGYVREQTSCGFTRFRYAPKISHQRKKARAAKPAVVRAGDFNDIAYAMAKEFALSDIGDKCQNYLQFILHYRKICGARATNIHLKSLRVRWMARYDQHVAYFDKLTYRPTIQEFLTAIGWEKPKTTTLVRSKT